jgi:translational regulator
MDGQDDDIFRGYGVEIRFKTPNDFHKVKETLERIGIPSRKGKILYQSCHVLHKQGRYAILHFKELFGLDGKPSNFDDEDLARRNTIVSLLEEWGLAKVLDPKKIEEPRLPMTSLKVLKFSEKDEWVLEQKYSIGKRRRYNG